MTRRWFDDAGRNIGIGLTIMLIVLASLMVAIFWPRPAGAQGRTAWQVWMECVGRYHGGPLPDYCINAYRAVTGR